MRLSDRINGSMTSDFTKILNESYDLVESEDCTKGEEARKTVEDQLDKNWEKKEKVGIEESEEVLTESNTITKFAPESAEYKALSDLADKLNSMSEEAGSPVRYTVDDILFDAGQNWWWTTVLAQNDDRESAVSGGWQALTPRQQEAVIVLGEIDKIAEEVFATSERLIK